MSTGELNELWKKNLHNILEAENMSVLKTFLRQEKDQGKVILPHSSLWFNALNSVTPTQVKVVILGQDPYPTLGHAHGLCFSVLPDVKPIPKSLINIFKELQDDLGIENHSGHLQCWADQ
ncbi:MAG: uracil-DNA glycosylase, partial [Gammaproteobacteria bacterium]|nr:uracil-DNA glycosylase [Gammaproteobacteria bacterium]